MLMKTNGAHKGSLSPASRVLLWGFEFVPLTGGLGGQLQNSPSAAPHGREPRTAPAESRGGEQSPESRGWVRRANRSPPGSPLWAMLSEPRWKSLELLIINSCMRERTHTQMYTQTPPAPLKYPQRPGRAQRRSHTHMCCTDGSGCPQHPVGTRGREPRVNAGPAPLSSPSPPFRGTAGEGARLFPQRRGVWGRWCPPQFPATETRQRRCKRELKQSCRPCPSGRR